MLQCVPVTLPSPFVFVLPPTSGGTTELLKLLIPLIGGLVIGLIAVPLNTYLTGALRRWRISRVLKVEMEDLSWILDNVSNGIALATSRFEMEGAQYTEEDVMGYVTTEVEALGTTMFDNYHEREREALAIYDPLFKPICLNRTNVDRSRSSRAP
jgi:hypothetical protein